MISSKTAAKNQSLKSEEPTPKKDEKVSSPVNNDDATAAVTAKNETQDEEKKSTVDQQRRLENNLEKVLKLVTALLGTAAAIALWQLLLFGLICAFSVFVVNKTLAAVSFCNQKMVDFKQMIKALIRQVQIAALTAFVSIFVWAYFSSKIANALHGE